MKKILFLTIILFTAFQAKPQGYDGYDGCAEQDSLALVAFYWATDGPNWTSNQNGFSINNLSDDVLIYHNTDYPYAGMGKWLEGPVKDWFGVLLEKQQVGNTTDSVWRAIHLRPTISRRSAGDNNLKGYVPKEVGMLTALEWFKVNGNVGIEGPVPDEVFHPTLIELDLEGAFFDGIITDAIRKCTRLEFTNLRDNYFDSVPVFDFYDDDVYGNRTIFLYRNQLTWATIEPTVDYAVANNGMYEARDQKNVGRAKEIVVTPGSSLTLTNNDAGSQGTYTWYKKGFNTFISDMDYSIASVSASDTGNYTVLIKNEYIRLNDENADYVNTFTKPIHVTFIPSTPVCENITTSYNGQQVILRFSKPMASPISSQASEFVVTANGDNLPVSSISRTGRLNDQLVLELESPVLLDQDVLISYTKGSVVDVNGGTLKSFSDREIENRARKSPTIVGAITRVNGEGIILTFDSFMDKNSLQPEGFTIEGSAGNSVVAVILRKGVLNDNISKEIELVLSGPLLDSDSLSVSYTMGGISALYGGSLQSFDPTPVTNVVSDTRIDVNMYVIDGTRQLQNVVVKGDMKSLPFNLYDDGTNGDLQAGDHTWSSTIKLNDGIYQWQVFERSTTITYDTVRTEDGNGQITITLTPSEIISDSLISADQVLSLTVDRGVVSGDSIFEYYNNTLTFVLDMTSYLDNNPGMTIEPYLMGIREDWAEGISMEVKDSSDSQLTYTIEVPGFKIGEAISFNFRNGHEWENSSPLARTHTVRGDDDISAVFGLITSFYTTESSNTVHLYPNPVKGQLNIRFDDNANTVRRVTIYSLYGRHVFSGLLDNSSISTENLEKGIYFIEIETNNEHVYRAQFIKM